MTVSRFYIPTAGQADTAARLAALGAVLAPNWFPVPVVATRPALVLYSDALNTTAVYSDIPRTLTAGTLAADPIVAADTGTANAATLTNAARNALAANATYLAAGAPTNPQVVAQVNALTKQVNALIRLAVQQLDSTSGT